MVPSRKPYHGHFAPLFQHDAVKVAPHWTPICAPMEMDDSTATRRAEYLHALAATLRAQAAAATMPGYAEKMRHAADALDAEATALEDAQSQRNAARKIRSRLS
jgi:hypothetical protein